MNINSIEHHLKFYTESGEVEHYGCMDAPFVSPRIGETANLQDKKIALQVERIVHELVEYEISAWAM